MFSFSKEYNVNALIQFQCLLIMNPLALLHFVRFYSNFIEFHQTPSVPFALLIIV